MTDSDAGRYATDRGVSDVVGYVLIFSLIAATVGVVTVVGFGALDDGQTAERINNVERAFDVFAANMENVYRDGAPSRATEMRLAGGELRHADSITITIEAENGENVIASPRPLIYADGDTEIVYAAGAILRSDGESAVMLKEPPFGTDSPTASFPIVETFRTSGPTAISTGGTLRVTSTARSINTTVPDSFSESGTYNVTIESPRSDAWVRYFESQPNVVVLEDESGTMTARVDADRLVAPRFLIRLQFSS